MMELIDWPTVTARFLFGAIKMALGLGYFLWALRRIAEVTRGSPLIDALPPMIVVAFGCFIVFRLLNRGMNTFEARRARQRGSA